MFPNPHNAFVMERSSAILSPADSSCEAAFLYGDIDVRAAARVAEGLQPSWFQ
jgi:hypothetical protein